LHILLPDAALVHWGTCEWQTTLEWTASGAWEGENYSVQVEE
jgi:hypothetical protein